jgi:hypothetical protein
MYKAAGLFDNLDIQGTEFTPKDVYTLNFFDKNYKKSEACEKANPGNNLGCQFLGKYKQTFPAYSTVDPYEKMCEHCTTIAPFYARPTGC